MRGHVNIGRVQGSNSNLSIILDLPQVWAWAMDRTNSTQGHRHDSYTSTWTQVLRPVMIGYSAPSPGQFPNHHSTHLSWDQGACSMTLFVSVRFVGSGGLGSLSECEL